MVFCVSESDILEFELKFKEIEVEDAKIEMSIFKHKAGSLAVTIFHKDGKSTIVISWRRN